MHWGVYVHIPFCKSKCHYCDFVSYAEKNQEMARYIDALKQEMKARAPHLIEQYGTPYTIYIGGGTPTALPRCQMEELFVALKEHFYAKKIPFEITVEANPGTVDATYLEALARAGVNRISFGVQSFSDRLLRGMGRIHSAKEARTSIRMAKEIIPRVSLDLIYGLPQQKMKDLQKSVAEAIALEVDHISVYGLQVEEGTSFFRMQECGELVLPKEETVEKMYDFLTEELPRQGYLRYEISNFARRGEESRHNLLYWRDAPYLGLGVAAHSYYDDVRWANLSNLEEYLTRIEENGIAIEMQERMTRKAAMEEYAFLALRTAEGISLSSFAEKFSVTFDEIYRSVADKFIAQGLLVQDDEHIHLTAQGMKLGNLVFEGFLLDE